MDPYSGVDKIILFGQCDRRFTFDQIPTKIEEIFSQGIGRALAAFSGLSNYRGALSRKNQATFRLESSPV